jgi:tripartite-type tricarboxylate transporter receptor subunit TctC
MIGLAPSIIVTSAKSKHNNLKEFIDFAKQGQGAHFATAGTGSTPHLPRRITYSFFISLA